MYSYSIYCRSTWLSISRMLLNSPPQRSMSISCLNEFALVDLGCQLSRTFSYRRTSFAILVVMLFWMCAVGMICDYYEVVHVVARATLDSSARFLFLTIQMSCKSQAVLVPHLPPGHRSFRDNQCLDCRRSIESFYRTINKPVWQRLSSL